MTRNYELVYYVAQKCVNYRVTGVSKNSCLSSNISQLGNVLTQIKSIQG